MYCALAYGIVKLVYDRTNRIKPKPRFRFLVQNLDNTGSMQTYYVFVARPNALEMRWFWKGSFLYFLLQTRRVDITTSRRRTGGGLYGWQRYW